MFMKTRSVTILICATHLALSGCGESHTFGSFNADVNGDGVVDDLDQINTAGLIACNSATWTSSTGTRPDAFYFPTSCRRDFTEPPRPERNLDVMFALDVTGSMGNELNSVRGGIQKLIDLIAAEKWNLRVGAIAFADAILEEHAASENLGELLTAMNPNQTNWKATPGFGGDAPEVGLAAMERGIDLLQSADPHGTVEEKILVYVSDAPAKLHSTYGFDVAHTNTAFKTFSTNLSAMPSQPSFRFFYSSTMSRKGLVDAMPTPLTQIEKLVQTSGVSGIRLPFPLATENLEDSFLVPLRKGAFRTERCALESVKYTHVETGGEVKYEHNISQSAHFSVAVSGWRSGKYKVTLEKKCSLSGEREEVLDIEMP
jgi:hypothetical protein